MVSPVSYPITLFEYLFEELFEVGEVGGAACHFDPRTLWGTFDYAQLGRWEDLQQMKPKSEGKSLISRQKQTVYRLL